MRHTTLILIFLLLATACEAADGAGRVAPPPMLPPQAQADVNAILAAQTAQAEYGRALDAQRRATEAAIDAQKTLAAARVRATTAAESAQAAAAQVTAQANQTREALAVQATRQALFDAATRQAVSVSATQTAQSAQATRTAEAAQYTATAQANDAQATRASASATATSYAASAQATRASANATETVVAKEIEVENEKAEWNKRLEMGRAIVAFVGGTIVVMAFLVLVGWAALRIIDAFVLRARVVRGATGTVIVIPEIERDGTQRLLIPERSPGPVIVMQPENAQAWRVETPVADADTTKREQAIGLMLAARVGGRDDTARELLEDLTAGDQVQVVEKPTPQLLPDNVKLLLDGEWKEEKT